LTSVLERIPAQVRDDYDCEILVVDDASEDRTYALGREYQRAHPEIRMTVLRNELNQGYGGNQKIGYTFAVERGFDIVVLLHGDGQYAPEEMPRLLTPLRDRWADAVFGSRMMTAFGALRGGMPLYKYVGNRALTTMQNALLRTRLSEFHSGYRAYSVPALRRIRFPLNSNDFHFDTEIIIQLLNAGQRIVEVPIPTHYGDEICYVDGVRYAKDVTLTTFQMVAHGVGVFNQRRFEPLDDDGHANSHYDVKLGYASSHQFALDACRRAAGCSTSARGPAGWRRSWWPRGARSPSSTSSRPRTRPATSRSSSRTSTSHRSSTPASTTTCSCST
jgi:glycosyltransferase involved in cell wall biosynthesis